MDEPATSKLLLTPAEMAEAIGVSERTLARITVPHGPLLCVRIRTGEANGTGKPRFLVRYRPVDVQAWIDAEVTGANGAAHNGNGHAH